MSLNKPRFYTGLADPRSKDLGMRNLALCVLICESDASRHNERIGHQSLALKIEGRYDVSPNKVNTSKQCVPSNGNTTDSCQGLNVNDNDGLGLMPVSVIPKLESKCVTSIHIPPNVQSVVHGLNHWSQDPISCSIQDKVEDKRPNNNIKAAWVSPRTYSRRKNRKRRALRLFLLSSGLSMYADTSQESWYMSTRQ